MFGYMTKIAARLRPQTVEERELAYLNGAADRVDLEYRERQVERGLFRQRMHGML
jgi:hypothetical protein